MTPWQLEPNTTVAELHCHTCHTGPFLGKPGVQAHSRVLQQIPIDSTAQTGQGTSHHPHPGPSLALTGPDPALTQPQLAEPRPGTCPALYNFEVQREHLTPSGTQPATTEAHPVSTEPEAFWHIWCPEPVCQGRLFLSQAKFNEHTIAHQSKNPEYRKRFKCPFCTNFWGTTTIVSLHE